MSSCADEPANDPADEFHLFVKAIQESSIKVPFDRDCFHPLVRTLRLWSEVHGFVSTATWTKKILVGLLGPGPRGPFWVSLGWDLDEGATLLSCFGDAFEGDQVGLVGRDILEPCLRHHDDVVVAAAYGVLETWREEDDAWQGLIDWLDEEDLEPDEDDVRQLDLELGNTSSPELSTEFLELPPDVEELEQFFEATRGCSNDFRAVVRHSELPGFLERALELHPAVTLGMLESHRVGTPCVRESNLEVHVSRGIVRAWRQGLTVSIEPTATSGSWLVFAAWA